MQVKEIFATLREFVAWRQASGLSEVQLKLLTHDIDALEKSWREFTDLEDALKNKVRTQITETSKCLLDVVQTLRVKLHTLTNEERFQYLFYAKHSSKQILVADLFNKLLVRLTKSAPNNEVEEATKILCPITLLPLDLNDDLRTIALTNGLYFGVLSLQGWLDNHERIPVTETMPTPYDLARLAKRVQRLYPNQIVRGLNQSKKWFNRFVRPYVNGFLSAGALMLLVAAVGLTAFFYSVFLFGAIDKFTGLLVLLLNHTSERAIAFSLVTGNMISTFIFALLNCRELTVDAYERIQDAESISEKLHQFIKELTNFAIFNVKLIVAALSLTAMFVSMEYATGVLSWAYAANAKDAFSLITLAAMLVNMANYVVVDKIVASLSDKFSRAFQPDSSLRTSAIGSITQTYTYVANLIRQEPPRRRRNLSLDTDNREVTHLRRISPLHPSPHVVVPGTLYVRDNVRTATLDHQPNQSSRRHGRLT